MDLLKHGARTLEDDDLCQLVRPLDEAVVDVGGLKVEVLRPCGWSPIRCLNP